MLEESLWQNAQFVEKKLKLQRRRGQWQGNPINRGNELS